MVISARINSNSQVSIINNNNVNSVIKLYSLNGN